MGKLIALWKLFRQGEAVADPAAWRVRADAVNAVLAVLAALIGALRAFGIEVELPPEDLASLALGVVVAVGAGNGIVHIVTDRRRGLPAVGEASPGGPGGGQDAY